MGISYKKERIAAASLVALLTFIIYLPALQNGFINWDDGVYVYENPNIQKIDLELIKWVFSIKANPTWHPLTLFSLSIDHAVWGLKPFGYHLTNIALHAFNTFLVFFLAYRLVDIGLGFQDSTINATRFTISVAFITALLFGIHPLHVESVAWISERKDVLYAAFFLLAILNYIKYVSNGSQKHVFYLISLLLFILSLMSKPMAVSLPVVLLIFDYYPFKRFEVEGAKKILIEKAPFFLISILSSVITIWAQGAGGALSPLEKIPLLGRIAVASRAYIFYLIKMVLPINLMPYYPYPTGSFLFSVEYLGSIVILLIITCVAISFFKKNILFCAVWLYYIATLIPVIGIVQVGPHAAADRYTYLPSLGPFLLIGVIVVTLYERTSKKNRMAIIVVLLLVSVLLCNKTIKQIAIWRDSITFWNYVIDRYDKSALAYDNRGTSYESLGNYQEAIIDYGKAIELNPRNKNYYNDRGIAYLKMGKYMAAAIDFGVAIELDPNYADAYYNLGLAYQRLGNDKQALVYFNKEAELNRK